jgi:MoaA/NifB/PqqE/SkfB family radical SAM enzyme
MVPWTHMFMAQDGKVFPCCYADRAPPIGDLRRSQVAEVWNGPEYRAMRLRMLAGEPSEACARCYELEEAGARSQRRQINAKYGHHEGLVAATQPDGALPEMRMALVDIRFSNVCNFKCRTCGPWASSSWAIDARALSTAGDLVPAIVRPRADTEQLWSEVREILVRAEEITLAGGEPLMMDEHYRVLDLLLENGRSDVELNVFTNLSVLEHRGRDVLALWRQFPKLRVYASVDGAGRRGEILRHGMVWRELLENCRRLREACPQARLTVSVTVSAMNVMHVPELHRELVVQGAIRAESLDVNNVLLWPEHLRAQILPAPMKREVEGLYREHIKWLAREHALGGGATAGLRNVLRFLNKADRSALVPRFLEYTAALDRLRGESFFDAFPELAPLAARE